MIKETNIINYDKTNKYYSTMIKETNIINYDKRNKYY